MQYYAVTWLENPRYTRDCGKCFRELRDEVVFQLWSRKLWYAGFYCSVCIKDIDVIYDCYLEVTIAGRKCVCNDTETAHRFYSKYTPSLEKI